MLTPLAVQNADLLRVLATGQFPTKTELAAHLGRDLSNLNKTLARLEDEELIAGLETTSRAKACLLAFDVAAGKVAMPENMIVLRHGQIRAAQRQGAVDDPLNPRIDWDSVEAHEDLASLRESILLRGVRQNLQVRPTADPETFEIIDGERRWRAVGQAIFEGDLSADFPLVCLVKDVDDRELMLDATDANVQRRDLSEIEEGKQFCRLRDEFGVSTKEIAERISRSQKYVQNRIRLTELPSDLQARMALPKDDPNHLGYKKALGEHLIEKRPPAAPKEPPAPTLGELSPKLALALLELADKAVKFPSKISQPGFTELLRRPDGGALTTLNERKIVTFREEGGKWHAKILAHSSGALAWLTERGFYGPYPEATIYGARKAVLSEAALAGLEETGLYATELLNVARAVAAPQEADDEELEEVEEAVAPAVTANPDEATDDTVTPAQLLILAEIADKMMREPQRTSTGDVIAHVLPSVRADEAILKPLRWGGYLAYGNDLVSDFYRTTELADRLLKARGFHPRHAACAIVNVRKFARRVLTGSGIYVTPWLNRATPEANPVRPEPQHAPEVLPEPVENPSLMADLDPHLMAEAFDRTSKRNCNALVRLLTAGDDAKEITLLAYSEDEARGIAATLADSGLYLAITIHARSGKLLMNWG